MNHKSVQPYQKATELRTKFGELAIDVANEVIEAIEHEDNRMYYEINFWKNVKSSLKNNDLQPVPTNQEIKDFAKDAVSTSGYKQIDELRIQLIQKAAEWMRWRITGKQ